MDLTTIKIPGKNNRVNSKKAIAERKALVSCLNLYRASADLIKQKRPRGRPLKLPTNDAVSQTTVASAQLIKKTKKRTLKNIKSRRKMSFLEKLPTELLFQVFLHCMNLELARASPVMAGKLSSEIVYLHTILSAFSPTWDRWHGREKFTGLKGNEEDRSLGTSEGDPKLQSAILRCRWVTVSRLLAAKDTWIQKNGQDRVFTPECMFPIQILLGKTTEIHNYQIL
jgi:hypothetical protein